jgi:D-glycero-D-manno-heptose 1,7-bisphosphate phosphatase
MSDDRTRNFANIQYVFLDRDGVLNRCGDGSFVTTWEQCELLPGVEDAIARLNLSGRKVIAVTNQRGVALGVCTRADVLALHHRLREHLTAHGARLDAIYFCPHDDGECNCRKPLPGLFEQAFSDFPGATAGNSVMVGDSISDIEAGANLGMRTVLIADPLQPARAHAARAAALATISATSLLDFVQTWLDIQPKV